MFNGIPNLRSEKDNITMEPWMLDELEKCHDNPIYFIETYVKINLVDDQIKYSLHDYQKLLITSYEANRFHVLNYSPMCGVHTCGMAYLLWYVVFKSDQNVAITNPKQSIAFELLNTLKNMYMELPMWLQPGVTTWNKKIVQLSNRNLLIATTTSADGIKGRPVNLLYISDFNQPSNKMNNFISYTFPTLLSVKQTKIIACGHFQYAGDEFDNLWNNGHYEGEYACNKGPFIKHLITPECIPSNINTPWKFTLPKNIETFTHQYLGTYYGDKNV